MTASSAPTPAAAPPSPALDVATIALFLAALLAPALDQCLRPDESRDSRHEARTPVERPGLPRTLAELAAFPRAFEAHFDDTFGLRDLLLRWNAIERWLWLGSSPTSALAQGRNGWAFLGTQSRDSHRGVIPLTEAELAAWAAGLSARRDSFAALGMKYLFVLCPTKEAIYPERAPASWTVVGPSRLDQLAARAQRDGLPFLDLRPALRAAKSEDRPDDFVYTTVGTHWNGRGGYVAYRTIVERLGADFPALAPLARDRCRAVELPNSDSLGTQLYVADLLPQRQYELALDGGPGYEVVHEAKFHQHQKLVTRKAIAAPRLLWLHDSFGPNFDQLLCESFAFVQAHWDWELPPDVLAVAGPDVVLETYTERVLVEREPRGALDLAAPTAEQEFERATDRVWTHDPTAEHGAVVAFAGAELERRGDALHLIARGERGGLLLPPLESAPGTVALLRLAVDCDEALGVEVFLRRAGQRRFSRRLHASCALAPGAGTAVLRLPEIDGRFEVLLRPVAPAEELVIRALEVRRAPAVGRAGT